MSTRSYRVAVVPGDGIGPEVTREAVKVLCAVAWVERFALEETWFDLGAERYLKKSEILPDDELNDLKNNDAVLLGAVGDPRVPPGILERGLLLRLRRELDLYLNLRPVKLYPGVSGALKETPELDLLIVRENSEGLYAGRGYFENEGTPEEEAIELSVNTSAKVERLMDRAFAIASSAGRSLTLVHKTNVLDHAGQLYQRKFEEASHHHPDVVTYYQHVDAAALLMVSDPSRFQVIITDNLFGDILSDLAAGLAGGLGFAPSGNINPGGLSLFEPVHGSAPDIAGKDIANPIAAILCVGMMLEHLGEVRGAARIFQTVSEFAAKAASGDLTTKAIGDMIAEQVA